MIFSSARELKSLCPKSESSSLPDEVWRAASLDIFFAAESK